MNIQIYYLDESDASESSSFTDLGSMIAFINTLLPRLSGHLNVSILSNSSLDDLLGCEHRPGHIWNFLFSYIDIVISKPLPN
jgi:hypothetical protein